MANLTLEETGPFIQIWIDGSGRGNMGLRPDLLQEEIDGMMCSIHITVMPVN